MIGIYVDNVNLPWMTHINKLSFKKDIVLFTNNFGPMFVASPLAVVSSINIWSFDGPVIATDTFSARYLVECPVPSKKYMYVNHIDWGGFDAEDSLKVFNTLELISEAKLADQVRSVWGETHVINEWNYEELERVLGN